MKMLTVAWSLAVLLGVALSAEAHPGGHGPITEERAIQLASLVATDLSERDLGLGFGQLDASWAKIPEDAKTIHVKQWDYIIVSLFHEKEARTLYILMSSGGDVYDANFSGEFPGLKGPAEDDTKE